MKIYLLYETAGESEWAEKDLYKNLEIPKGAIEVVEYTEYQKLLERFNEAQRRIKFLCSSLDSRDGK